MRVERFTGEVSAQIQVDTPTGLLYAVRKIVPQNKRQRVLGYKLDSVQAISGDHLKKPVTIAVTYQ
jgi:hypothetical protein